MLKSTFPSSLEKLEGLATWYLSFHRATAAAQGSMAAGAGTPQGSRVAGAELYSPYLAGLCAGPSVLTTSCCLLFCLESLTPV